MNQVVLRTKDVEKVYGSEPNAVHAVKRVSLDVHAGELVLIMGPSGSGKTTLLSILGTLLRPTVGHVEINGIDTTALSESELPALRSRHIGFIFQAFNLLSALTVEENVLFPARLIPGSLTMARKRSAELLGRLGLVNRRNALPRSLSGGEKQRVAIARALINEPPILLADEPTGNLDSKVGQEVMMVLHDVAHEEGRSVVIVTHDSRIEDLADRILWIEDGILRDQKPEPREWLRDPVCGMRLDRRSVAATVLHDGQEYSFCAERCRRRFLQEPHKYAAVVAKTKPKE